MKKWGKKDGVFILLCKMLLMHRLTPGIFHNNRITDQENAKTAQK